MPLTVVDFTTTVLRWSDERPIPPKVVGYLNAHVGNLVVDNPETRRLIAGLDLVYADGMGIVYAAKRMGTPLPERINAADFIQRILWAAEVRGLRVALVGGTEADLSAFIQRMRKDVSDFAPCLSHHGYFARGSVEERALLGRLREAAPDLVLVGMGTPRQEQWAMELRGCLEGGVIWCVGALFENVGSRWRAPVWMREWGIEWLARLVQEPWRLAGRYLVGNLRFVLRVEAERRRRASGSGGSG